MAENKTLSEKLGIIIRVSRVSTCFNERGTNEENMKVLNESIRRIEELKKKGFKF